MNRCPYTETQTNHGHPYVLGCLEPAGHLCAHEMRPEHRIRWEECYGYPPPAQVAHLRPVDGDWENLDISNWQVVSVKKTRAEQAERKLSNKEGKYCTECVMFYSLDSFPDGRNVCRDCHLKRLKKNTKTRQEHIEKYRCQIVDGVHYHLLDRAAFRKFWLTQYCKRLREESSSKWEYIKKLAEARLFLRHVIDLQDKEASHG